MRSTTIISVRNKGQVAMAGDGQVSMGDVVMKTQAKKVRRLYEDKILAGFAGSGADALTLFDQFEQKAQEYRGNITRAAVELTKHWRSDKVLRRLEALMIVADNEKSFLLSGGGDVIEPDDGILAIGSGGSYALAAARALKDNTDLSALEIAKAALKYAGGICVFTNDNISFEEIT